MGAGNYSDSGKRILSIRILEILKKYTDDEHFLGVQDVVDYLRDDYLIEVNRKIVSKNLNELADEGFGIDYEIVERSSSEIRTNYRYNHEVDNGQLRLLADAVLFSKNISKSEAKGLLELIGKLGNKYTTDKIIKKHISNLPLVSADRAVNNEMLNNIDILDEAIGKGKQVAFVTNEYGKDKKLHPKMINGEPVVRIVNPYNIIANYGRYYLICNYENYDNAISVRIDKITKMEILESNAKPKSHIKNLNNIPKTMAEQLYMQGGEPEIVTFKCSKTPALISDLVDWFGQSINFISEDEETVTCRVKTNAKAMKYWAMQYSDHVEVIEPESLREDIKSAMRRAWRKYNNGNDSLIESSEEIKKLIDEWNKIVNAVRNIGREEELDISFFGNTVRKTYAILQPFFGKHMEGQYAELMFNLRNIHLGAPRLFHPNRFSVFQILSAILSRTEHAERWERKGIPEGILPIMLPMRNGDKFEHIIVNVDIDNFEEDYLTLFQYVVKMQEQERINLEKRHEENRNK